jgi:hypothetical protein
MAKAATLATSQPARSALDHADSDKGRSGPLLGIGREWAMKGEPKVMAARILDKGVDAKQRRRERDKRARDYLHDWYVRQLLAKRFRWFDIRAQDLPEALTIAKRWQLLLQRLSQGRITLDEYAAILAVHRSKDAPYMDYLREPSDPP